MREVFGVTARIGLDRLIQPADDFAAAERLFNEVQCAILDGADRHGNVALSGDHEDRRRIVLAVKLFQNVEAGFAGNMYIEQDAGWRPASCNRQQRRTIREADHLIASCRQNHRQGFTNGRVIIDHENLAAGDGPFRPCAIVHQG